MRSDIADWSPNLHNTFSYFTVKKLPEYKDDAMRVLDILFNKTEHNSYFAKNVFGSKQKITQAKNPTLYLVVLTWLRQLQQCFYEYNEVNMAKDWNRHGRYCGTTTKVAQNAPTLSNINMSPVRSDKKNIVSDLSYFIPNEDRKDVVASLKQWAAMLLKPDIPMILKEENMDEDTRERFSCAKKPSEFSITKMDYKNTESEEADDEPTFNTSPDKHKNKTNKELLQNISTGLVNILTVALKKKGNNKKLKVGEVSELENVTETVSSFVAFVNKTRSTKFNNLQDMNDYYQEKAQLTTENNMRRRLDMEDSDDSSDSSISDDTSSSESTGNKKAKAKKRKPN